MGYTDLMNDRNMGMNTAEYMDRLDSGVANSDAYIEPVVEKPINPYIGNGRKAGSKNKTTIFKEIIREGFEKKMLKDINEVINVVVTKAIEGDMIAAKMLLDRVLPTSKAIDINAANLSGEMNISINIGSLEESGDIRIVNEEAIEVNTQTGEVIPNEIIDANK